MSLNDVYQKFLAAPRADALAENASLNYITTTESIKGSDKVVKHFSAKERQLKIKSEKALSVIESSNALCLEIETTIEFTAGGGSYLPNTDDNFLTDRTVEFPVTHIVHFDDNKKISQMRLSWDQASLLCQLDLISGARARNWSIKDGRDMVRMIKSSAAAGPSSVLPSKSTSNGHADSEEALAHRPSISSKRSSVSATGDPHASLSLFEKREQNEGSVFGKSPVAPRQSARPQHRGLEDILASNEDSTERSRSPAKAGAGKNFQANRLFDQYDETATTPSPAKKKADAKKYNHFEFGQGEEAPVEKPKTSHSNKGGPSWNFEDFATPEKKEPKVRGQDVRHFNWSDNEEDEESPVKRPVVHQARPDAKTHFDFEDEGTPEAQRQQQPMNRKGHSQNNGLGLYKDPILGEETPIADRKKPLSTMHNVNRSKDFGSHWDMTDDSPVADKFAPAQPIPESRKKVASNNTAHYSLFEESQSPQLKENRGIKTAGNGMGGRKGTAPAWAYGAEDDEEEEKAQPVRPQGRRQKQEQEQKDFWDF